MAAEMDNEARILSLFEGAGTVDTPTPGVRVWLARDTGDEKRAMMIKRVSETRKARATEALSLHHANIVRTRRWLAEGGYLYVVRDVVKGKNLRQTISSLGGARPSPELLRKIITPLIDALSYAHGQGIPHGGVSADNILIADDGGIWLSDFGTTDPGAPQHLPNYSGKATVLGDVRALARVVAAYLPTSGSFFSPATRGKLEGILARCDTLSDLRETLGALERLASVPPSSPQNRPAPASAPTPPPQQRPGPPPLQQPAPTPTPQVQPIRPASTPIPIITLAERNIRVPQGGGGFATVIVRNDGTAPLVIRMIATQHAWLNLREPEIPLTIAPNGAERIGFNISAARLTPGEYRSEVYLLANAGGGTAETQQNGWFKHTTEILITVESSLGPALARPNR